MQIKAFQVYGERCCGTNFIIRLLEKNLQSAAFTETYGFKHWFPQPGLCIPNDTLVLIVERSWPETLRSLHRTPWHVHPSLENLSFSTFLRTPWHCIWDERFWGVGKDDPRWKTEMWHERNPLSGERFANVVRMKASKLAHWKALASRCAHYEVVPYEEVRADPAGFVQGLCERFAITPQAHFEPVTTYKGLSSKGFEPKTYHPLDPVDLAFIQTERRAEELRVQEHLQKDLRAVEPPRTRSGSSH